MKRVLNGVSRSNMISLKMKIQDFVKIVSVLTVSAAWRCDTNQSGYRLTDHDLQNQYNVNFHGNEIGSRRIDNVQFKWDRNPNGKLIL